MTNALIVDAYEVTRRIAQHERQLERLETLPAGGGGGVGAHNAALIFKFDRGGAVLATTMGVFFRVHFGGTIVRWTVASISTGTIRFNVAKATYAAWPTVTNIDGSDPPQLVSTNKAESLALTGWTTGFASGDIFYVTVDAAVTPALVTRVSVILEAEPS